MWLTPHYAQAALAASVPVAIAVGQSLPGNASVYCAAYVAGAVALMAQLGLTSPAVQSKREDPPPATKPTVPPAAA